MQNNFFDIQFHNMEKCNNSSIILLQEEFFNVVLYPSQFCLTDKKNK
jgi:hypothetical protein